MKRLVLLFLFVAFPLCLVGLVFGSVTVSLGQADLKVYIIALNGVSAHGVGNLTETVQGAADASTLQIPYDSVYSLLNSSYFGSDAMAAVKMHVNVTVVSDWDAYRQVVETGEDVIVVNAHGETLPVPANITYEDWIDTVADAMTNRQVTWVHTAGYPFYYAWYQGAYSETAAGDVGFKRLMSHIGLENVACSSDNTNVPLGLNGYVSQNMGLSWDKVSMASYADRGRPLSVADFKNYTVLPIWYTSLQPDGWMTGAVIDFVKPSARVSGLFGAYVHIGTYATYVASGPGQFTPTDGDFLRGYIGAAVAVWVGVQSFGQTTVTQEYLNRIGSTTSDTVWGFSVTPVVTSATFPDTNHVELGMDFGVYGFMRTNGSDYTGHFKFSLDTLSSGCTVLFDQSNASVASESADHGTIGGFDWVGVGEFGLATLLFLIPEPTSKLGAMLYYYSYGGLLFSDFLHLTSQYVDSSNHNPDNSGFELEEKNLPTFTNTNGGYRSTEFETTIRAKVTVDLTSRGIWSIVPLTWEGDMKDSAGSVAVSVSSPISLAVYNNGLSSSLTTAFFDDFKDLGGWQTWDANPASGSDYWGVDHWTGELYCAGVGNNSVYGDVPNVDALGETVAEYDNNMYSPLERGIDLCCYQSGTLRFLAHYYIVSGDYLNLQFYSTTGWHTLLNLTDVSSGDIVFSYPLPKDASEIEFIFQSNSAPHEVGTGFFIRYLEIIGQLPNDANTNMKAGESFSDALNIPVGSYTGYLGYLNATYQFYVSPSDLANRGNVFALVTPPSSSEFTLDLFGPGPSYIHKAGPSESLQYFFSPSDTHGNWYLRVSPVYGFGQYFFEIGKGHAGGGCPYVYAWNGTGFVRDNNILPASETGNCTDTKDYYLLQQPLVPLISTRRASLYSLQIREFENNTDFIDQVKLMAVDHSQGTSIAVTQEGEIVTYTNPANPLSCVDNCGNSRLAEVARMDGNISDPSTYFQGFSGDWLLVDFGRVTASNTKLILRDDQKCAEDNCINVQVPDAGGGWRTVEVLSPRDFWSMEAMNMTNYLPTDGDFVVRLLWTAPHRLDYVGLDTSAQAQVGVSSAPPILAIHSTLGDVRARLLCDDENCVELVNGQQITLAFILPNPTQGATRDFIFYTDGYYYTITP